MTVAGNSLAEPGPVIWRRSVGPVELVGTTSGAVPGEVELVAAGLSEMPASLLDTIQLSPSMVRSLRRTFRSSASLTFSRSSWIAPETVLSNSRLWPAIAPRAWSSSSGAGTRRSSPNTSFNSSIRTEPSPAWAA